MKFTFINHFWINDEEIDRYNDNDVDLISISATSRKWSLSEAARSDRAWKYRFQKLEDCVGESYLSKDKLSKETSVFENYIRLRKIFLQVKPIVREKFFKSKVGIKKFKFTFVGDGYVGKTSLLLRYGKDVFVDVINGYLPTVCEVTFATTAYQDQLIALELWDSFSDEDIDTLRPLIYPSTDVFVICFSVSDPKSLSNIKYKWIDKIQEMCSTKFRIAICGNKIDLRNNEELKKKMSMKNEHILTEEEGRKMAKELRVDGYFETSSLTKEGIPEFFQGLISIASGDHKKGDGKPCMIM